MSRNRANLILVVGCCVLAMWTNIKAEESAYNFSPSLDEVERCAEDASQCAEFSTYPSAYIEMLINNGRIKKEWFQEHGILQKEVMKTELYSNNTDVNDGFQPLCETIYHSIQYPKGGITRNGKFVYIVQMKVNNVSYHQPMVYKSCKKGPSDNLPCQLKLENGTKESLAPKNNYSFVCDEEEALAEVVGITTGGMVVRSEVKYICCCVCKFRRN